MPSSANPTYSVINDSIRAIVAGPIPLTLITSAADSYGRPAMIRSASAGPMPGSDFNSLVLALLTDTNPGALGSGTSATFCGKVGVSRILSIRQGVGAANTAELPSP